MTVFKTTLLAAAVLVATPLVAQAESQFVDGPAGPAGLSASARLDFQVTIPKILLLQVGAVGSINRIDFDLSGTPSIVGNGTAQAATAGSGDLGNGAVTAILKGNGGNITLSSLTSGALGNGAGDTISYSQIVATSSNPALVAPALADAASTTTTVTATGKVVNQSAQWTYKYANSALVAPGVYGGTDTNNSRVTYTASMP